MPVSSAGRPRGCKTRRERREREGTSKAGQRRECYIAAVRNWPEENMRRDEIAMNHRPANLPNILHDERIDRFKIVQ
jgi:hypothetical protein